MVDRCAATGSTVPIALAAEIFAERWTPIIIRNLHLGCGRFNEILDGAPGLPRSVLSQRLRALERSGVVSRTATGRSTCYRLTASGHELAEVCLALGAWGARWRDVRPEDQDPYLALWTAVPDDRARTPCPGPGSSSQFHITDRAAPEPLLARAVPHGQRGLRPAAGFRRRRRRSPPTPRPWSAGTPESSRCRPPSAWEA